MCCVLRDMRVYKPAKKNFQPYDNQSRIKRRSKRSDVSLAKFYWLGVFILAIFGLLTWWLFFSPTFRLEEIPVSQAKNFASGDLKNFVWDKLHQPESLLPKNSLWLINVKDIKQELNNRYYLDKLSVKKNWPHKLKITFEEKNYALAWNEDNNYYLINFQGDIINNSGAVPPGLLVVYNQGAKKNGGERRINVEEKYLVFADQLNKLLNEKIKGLTDRRIFVDDEVNTVKIQITNGPIIKLNTEDSIDKQISKLETIRRQELSDGRIFNSQKYIDLRYGDRIFYQ